MTEQQKILAEVVAERNRQDAKFGPNRKFKPSEWLMILGEEVGEANQAALEVHFGGYPGGCTLDDYRKELIQVAAVAVAAIESLDAQAEKVEPEKLPDLGICKRCFINPATTDYNSHQHYVCETCNGIMNRQFDEEYR